MGEPSGSPVYLIYPNRCGPKEAVQLFSLVTFTMLCTFFVSGYYALHALTD